MYGDSLQETFDIGLEAFEKEGIANLTSLHDQLVSASHEKTEVVKSKFEAVTSRWKRLQEEARKRREKLDEVQGHYHHAENLCLMFARKASAFNSWFENAEEDMTDPVHCNNIEEVRVLKEAHEKFKESLGEVVKDFDELAEMDKKVQVSPNPKLTYKIYLNDLK